MIHEPDSERVAETLGHLCGKLESEHAAALAHPRGKPARPFSIAISREAGTRGTAVAEEVGRRLQWRVYDHQLVTLVAKDMGVRTKLLESIDEKRTSWLLENFEMAFGVPMVSEPAYVHHLAKTMLALSIVGECVVVGHGAAQILPADATLRVRLAAPLSDRIDAITRDKGKRADEARQYVTTADRNHSAFIREHFQKDPAEPHQYDLCLNTARFSIAQCAGLIVDGLRDLQENARANVQ